MELKDHNSPQPQVIRRGSVKLGSVADAHQVFTVEQLSRVREAFDFYDRDMKEELAAEDAQYVLHALGVQVTDEQNQHFLNREGGPQRRVSFGEVVSICW
jgi:Ca2+-binding EF-hand superfamily protein